MTTATTAGAASALYIVAGLGNPGRRYEGTRHNIGFITVDFLAEQHQVRVTKIRHKALTGEGMISGRKVLLVKPQTYMNLSGNSIREIMAYYKAPPENLLVIYDDADLPAGQIRIRKKGGAGTHNGMRSILYDLQTEEFPRIRVGVGQSGRMDLGAYVLSGFRKDEREIMEEAVVRAAEAVACVLEKGMDKAMAAYNRKPKAAEEEREEGKSKTAEEEREDE